MEVTCHNKLRQNFDINKELFVIHRAIPLIRLYSALVDRSCLLAKWFKETVNVNWGNSEYTWKKNGMPAHAVNYYRSLLCERVFDPLDHKQPRFDSFTFMESATGS